MNIAYLLTGGNLGDRMAALKTAEEMVDRQCGHVMQASSLYETAPWGNTDQPAFLNQALAIQTGLNAKQLIRYILKIEKLMGRIRKEKNGPRIIDIDILLFNQEIFNYSFLTVPHPELQNRRFALMPLAEIAPDIIHPIFNKTTSQLLHECKDELGVIKYN
jgi:2-amino-4-hydroxy-6-hydroxymethyldihydropteridine diphosphokinase